MVKFNRDFDDDPPVYDEDADTEVRETEGSSLLMAIVISLLILVAFGGVVWLAYNSGVAHGHEEMLQQNAQNGTKGLPVNSSVGSAVDDSNDGNSRQGEQPPPQDVAQTAQPQSAPASRLTTPVAPAAVPQPQVKTSAAQPPAPETKTVEVEKKTVAKIDTKPPASPSTKMTLSAKPPVKSAPPQAKTAVAPANLLPPAAKPATKSIPAGTSASVSSSGGALLQIGAYKTESDAMSAWKTYKAKYGAVLNGAGPNVLKVDLGDKGTWYRLRIGSFAGKDAAAAVCEKLKASGGACIPAK